MNYFAHGYRFIDRPYYLAGTAVPDWLRVADRDVRVRPARALLFVAQASKAAEAPVVPDSCPRSPSSDVAALAERANWGRLQEVHGATIELSAAEPRGGQPPGTEPGGGRLQGVEPTGTQLHAPETVGDRLLGAAMVGEIAAGIVQHYKDDAWFHGTPVFASLSSSLSRLVRDALGPDEGLRCWFLGHILVELLLDAELISAQPHQLEAYYAALADVPPELVQQAVNLMAPRRAERLAAFIGVFLRERFLFDYGDDVKLAFRLEQVLRRAGLSPAGEALQHVLPSARRLVSQRAADLLATHSRSTTELRAIGSEIGP